MPGLLPFLFVFLKKMRILQEKKDSSFSIIFFHFLLFMPHFIGLRTVLGIDHTATPDEVKTAYRQRARQYHPDLNPTPEAAVMMKKITFAYETLTDDVKKAAFEKEQRERARQAQKQRANHKKVAKSRKKK